MNMSKISTNPFFYFVKSASGLLLFFFVHSSQANEWISCQKKLTDCNDCQKPSPAQTKQACEIQIATCKKMLMGSPLELKLLPHLKSCDSQNSCTVKDPMKLLKGCSSLTPDFVKPIEELTAKIKKKVLEIDQECLHLKSKDSELSRKSKEYQNCLIKKLPPINLPTEINWQKYKSQLHAWSDEVQQKVVHEIQKDCGNMKSKSEEFYKCQFSSGMNAFLTELQTPYEKLGLKELTDHVTEVYINQVVQHQKINSCFDEEGTAIEFCHLAASISYETIALAIDFDTSFKNPILKAGRIEITNSSKSFFTNEAQHLTLDGKAVTIAPILKEHYEEHMVPDTQTIIEHALHFHKRTHQELKIFEPPEKPNLEAKLQISKLLLKSQGQADKKDFVFKELVLNDFIIHCLRKKEPHCPDETLMREYTSQLTPVLFNQLQFDFMKLKKHTMNKELSSVWRHGKFTSLVPEKIMNQFMNTWKNNPEELKIKQVPKIIRGLQDETFKFEYKSEEGIYRFSVVICSPLPPETSCWGPMSKKLQPGDVMSVYPLCGPNVVTLKKLTLEQMKEPKPPLTPKTNCRNEL